MVSAKPTLNQEDIDLLRKIFLTKNDAKSFLTKDDAKSFLTKNDAKNLSTKDDLKLFATKRDLNKLATKSDIKKLDKKLTKKFDELFNFLDREWSKLAIRISYHDDIHGIDTKNL